MNYNTLKSLMPLAAMGILACGGQSPEGTDQAIDLDAVTADDSELSVYKVRGGFLTEIRNDAAQSLYESFVLAGGFQEARRGDDHYLFGRAVACVSRGGEPLCQMVSSIADTDSEGFDVTLHGARGNSAASELFGALARAQDILPTAVRTVRSDRWVCAKDSREVWCGLTPAIEAPPAEPTVELVMRYVGLDNLGPDYVYEGWLITSEGPVTSGRFEVTERDQTFSFDIAESIARDSSLFVLTIEPKFNDDPAPAPTHIVAGDFGGFVADLGVQHPAALGTFFGEAAGAYMLAAPSEPSAPYNNGIWFLDPAAGPAPSLNLPKLPTGWAYEGWVVTENGPISTGRFTDVMGEDSDGAGPAAGPQAGPPFPGQDFVSPALDLIGATVVISVEPEPDNSPAPFTLKPLVDTVEDPGGPGVLQGMRNQAEDTNPAGITAFFDKQGNLLR